MHDISTILYPPKQLTDRSDRTPFERWAEYPDRPSDWLHHKALTRNRLASIDRLFPPRWQGDSPSAPRATIADWLGALIKYKDGDNAVLGSMAAVQTAATIETDVRRISDLGDIVLTKRGDWRSPNPEHLFLPIEVWADNEASGMESYVHPGLVSDGETLSALQELGLKSPSPESAFKLVAEHILLGRSQEADNEQHIKFWAYSRRLQLERALAVIRAQKDFDGVEIWPTKLRVQTFAGEWRPLYSVLLPGSIVPGDGNRDDEVTVNTHWHHSDDALMRELGVTELPQANRNLALEADFKSFRDSCRSQYSEQDGMPHNPGLALSGLHVVKRYRSIGSPYHPF